MPARSRSLFLLLLAIASGGVAAWLALGYLRSQAQPLLAASPSSGVAAVAARDLPVGTVVTEQDVRLVEWPGDAVPPGLVTARENAVGRGVMAPVRLNEPFMESKLAPRGAGGGMPTIITEGMRALSIRVDEVIGVAGFVVPGTRVDVLLTMGGGAGEQMTRVLLQNIATLAAGPSIQVDAEGKPQTVPVITMLVSPEQAETLAMAASQGRIQLTLRNVLDTLPVRTSGVRASGLLAGRPSPASGTAGPRRVQTRTPAVEETIVEGFRGGERTVTRFRTQRTRDSLPLPPELP